jgi:hypothetical protein
VRIIMTGKTKEQALSSLAERVRRISSPLMDMKELIPNKVASRVLCAALVALPICWAFHVMLTHWVAVPWWDEWLTPGDTLASYYRGTLHFADLWSQHNESRKLFPRLLYLALFVPAGWDVRYGMALTFAWVCAGSAGLYCLLRQCVSRPIACCGFIFMNLLLFSPRQYENFLYGIEGENFTPAFALVFALVCNLRAKSFRMKAMTNGLLALLSTYTCANGMLVWLLAFPAQWKGLPVSESTADRRFWRIAYSLAGIVSIVAYFIGYKHPPDTPPFAIGISKLPRLLHYFTIWVGDLFITSAPAFVGVFILSLFAWLVVVAIRRAEREDSRRAFYPWLNLGSYVLISGLVTASGRVGFGVAVAFDVRYTVFTVFLYIAVIGLFCTAYQNVERSICPKFVALVGAALLLAGWVFTFRQEMPQLERNTTERQHLQSVARWSLAIPANPDLHFLSPYPETLQRIRTLAEHDALRPRLIDGALTRAVERSDTPTSKIAGYLDRVAFVSPDRLLAEGWGQIPGRDAPADCVILGFRDEMDRWKLFGVTETGLPRPDVAIALGNPHLAFAGFGRIFAVHDFPKGSVIFEARAIDLRHKQAFPLAGAMAVTRSKD